MGEIKSTLDLVLEKTKNLTLSSEEKEEQNQKEIENRIKGMVQKYQDGLYSKSELMAGYELLKKDYNLSTALRQTSTGFLFYWVFYLPLFLIGFPFEVLLTVYAVNLIYQFWVHTQIVRRLGVLDYILVTPSNHRVHHAQNERYIDKNYGGMLILWDRMFGSWFPATEYERLGFGIGLGAGRPDLREPGAVVGVQDVDAVVAESLRAVLGAAGE